MALPLAGKGEERSWVAKRADVMAKQLDSLLDRMTAAFLGGDLPGLDRIVLEGAEALTGSGVSYLQFFDPLDGTATTAMWSRPAGTGSPPPDVHHRAAGGLWEDCLRSGRAVVQNTVGAAVRDAGALPRNGETSPQVKPAGHVALWRHLGVPVLETGPAPFVLGVGNKPAPYDPEDMAVLERVGGVFAAMRAALLYRRRERARIASIGGEDWTAGIDGAFRPSSDFLMALGYDPAQPPDLSALIAAEDRPAFASAMEGAADGAPLSVDVRLATADGRFRWYSLFGSVERDERGTFQQVLGIALDRESERGLSDRARWLASHDALTRLPNRSALLDHLGEIQGSPGGCSQIALFALDLDKFSSVNAKIGVDAGDRLLRQVADELTLRLEVGDLLARTGGDEFCLVRHAALTPAQAGQFAEELLSAVRAVAVPDEDIGFLTAGIGISLSASGPRPETSLEEAESALHMARAQGGNHFAFFERQATERQMDEIRLSRLVSSPAFWDSLRVVYQAQVRLADQRIMGVEALVRSDLSGQMGIGTERLIATIEDMGLTQRLGRAVRDLVIADVKAMGLADEELPVISINFSPVEFADVDHVRDFIAAIKASGLNPEKFEIEITERSLLAASEALDVVQSMLQQSGVRLALDDFGSGYSSLRYLTHIQVDKIKIDKVFINGIETNGRERRVVESIIALARGLDAVALAEGVEEAGQARLLKELGCEMAQGYHFCRPVGRTLILQMIRGNG